MNQTVKKIASYILVGIVIFVTILSVLAIWDVITLEDIFWKTSQSLFIIFLASLVILFISTVVASNDKKNEL
jgi:hypothetical protein